MEIYRKHFGKKLKDALTSAGLKQVDLADKLDVNASAVSQWINGKDFPEDSRLPEICRILNIAESYFVRDEQDSMTAGEFLDLLENNKDVIFLLPKIPKDVIRLLSRQDDIYFDHIRRVLHGLEEKKKAAPVKKKAIS